MFEKRTRFPGESTATYTDRRAAESHRRDIRIRFVRFIFFNGFYDFLF